MSGLAALSRSRGSASRRPGLRRIVAIGLGTLLFGAIAGSDALSGHSVDVVAFVALLVPVAVWFRPQLGPTVLLLAGLLIEQFSISLTNGTTVVNVPITNDIPMYHGLGSLHLEPADLLPVVLFAIYMIRSARTGERWWPKTQLSLAVAAMLAAVVFAEVWGIAHHGQIRESLFECRPFIYLAAAYLLTAVTIRTRSAIYAMLWALVIAEVVKFFQALYVWINTRSFVPEPQNVLGHEEAMFETLFFIVLAVLWLFDIRGRLRTVATRVAPLVLFTDMINDRRVAWLMLGAGLMVVVVIAYRMLPQRRRFLVRCGIATAFVLALYLPAYWNHTDGTLGKPADAVRSQFDPTPRDALSDEYRIDENANLKLNIAQAGLLGDGFGREIDYALPMPGLVTAIDSSILYVPHNSVLYVLMRLGLLGATAFWAMLGAAIIAGCRLARSHDKLLAAVGTIVAAMVVAWAFEGAEDLGFTFSRVMIVIGCFLGLLEAARHINAMSGSRAGSAVAGRGSEQRERSPHKPIAATRLARSREAMS